MEEALSDSFTVCSATRRTLNLNYTILIISSGKIVEASKGRIITFVANFKSCESFEIKLLIKKILTIIEYTNLYIPH